MEDFLSKHKKKAIWVLGTIVSIILLNEETDNHIWTIALCGAILLAIWGGAFDEKTHKAHKEQENGDNRQR